MQKKKEVQKTEVDFFSKGPQILFWDFTQNFFKNQPLILKIRPPTGTHFKSLKLLEFGHHKKLKKVQKLWNYQLLKLFSLDRSDFLCPEVWTFEIIFKLFKLFSEVQSSCQKKVSTSCLIFFLTSIFFCIIRL